MNVNIVSANENKLLERKEVRAEVGFDGPTPKRAELKQAISGKIGANPEMVTVNKVSSNFGKKAVVVIAHVYTDKDKLMKTEPDHIKIREGLMEKKKKEAKAAAPAKKRKE
ncbi:hypothetical protein HZC07_04040 [Candidatus Micrarchaeota archaeon]|nr:hypothetical protein [Candidatus Micrarchaeota archaeon]